MLSTTIYHYAYLECLIQKLMCVKVILKIHSQSKVGKHIPSGFSMSKISSFESIEYKRMMYIE